MTLTALRPILLDNTQYERGDALPANNPDLVEAWIECGSAEYRRQRGQARKPGAPESRSLPAARRMIWSGRFRIRRRAVS